MMVEEDPVIPLAVKRAAIVAGVLLLLLIAVLVVRGYFRGQQRQVNLARYTEQLTDPDPRQRLAAAELVLDAVPGHESATLTAATALLELREPLRARALLTDVQAELGTELSRRVALLKAQAYFQEARAVIDNMTPQSADMAQQNLDQILERVDELRSVLADQEHSTYERQLLEARALDMRAAMLHAMMGREASDLARAQVVAFDEQIEMVGVRVSDLRGQIDTLERRLALLCKTMRQDDPTAQWPRLLLFRSRVRSNQLVEARVLAGQVAATPNLDASVAGEMAWALLNLDHTGMQTSTAEDLALAELLIRQADVSRGQPLPLRQARAIVELRHGRAEEAVESIAQLQRDFPMVMSLNWLLGRALVQANRPAQAVRLLTPLVERTVTAEGRHMLAMALVGVSDYEAAQRELRKSLELDSQNLSARLELARLMMLEGDAAGAEPDIQAATALNPDHPQVMALNCQLMVTRKDAKGLRAYVERHAGDGATLLPRQVELAAAMLLDDRVHVQRHLQSLGEAHWDWLATLAQVWSRAGGASRSQAAVLVAVALTPVLDRLPLSRVQDPVIDAVRRAAMIDPQGERPVAPVSPMEPLVQTRFFPFPQQWGLTVLDLARERWPGEAPLALRSAELRLWLGEWAAARDDLNRAIELDATLTAGDVPQAMLALLSDDIPALERRLAALDMTSSATAAWLHLHHALRRNDTARATAVLTHLLKEQTWCELALLEALRDSTLRQQDRQIDTWVDLAQQLHPSLGVVAAGRVDLSRQQPAQAVQRLANLLQMGEEDSMARGMSVDVSATALLAQGQFESAAAMVESMGFTGEGFKHQWTLAGLDAAVEALRPTVAAASVLAQVNNREHSPWMMDQLLARAAALHPPRRMERLTASLLTVTPDDSLLMYYRAAALLADNDLTSARQLLETLLRRQPGARRVRLLLARLERQEGQEQAARAVLAPMLEAGGASAAAAQRELDRPTTPPPTLGAVP
jgi:predicted Zn-dependent protease